MKPIYIFPLALLLFTFNVNAIQSDAELKFQELCKYDKFCKLLKNRDGTFIPPKDGLMEVLKILNKPLREISQTLSVDPAAVAGAILAENSLNVQVDPDTHAFLETIKANPLANDISKLLRGKSFSLGLGQIKPESATEAEAVLAKVENRKERPADEIKKALLNPIENLKFAAAIIRKCQDEYKKAGFDVGSDQQILATLYNLGDCQKRANEAAKSHRLPKPNYFGVFVANYKDEIIKGVGLNDPNPTPLPGRLAPNQLTMGQRLKKPATLFSHPPQCNTEGPGKVGEYNKTISLRISDRTVIGEGDYTILTPGIDCDLKDWSLIQTSKGAIGWISTASLNENSEPSLNGTPVKCGTETNACIERLKQEMGTSIIGSDPSGLLEFKLAPGSDVKVASLKTFNPEVCLGAERPGWGRRSSSNQKELISSQKAGKLAEQLEQKKGEIAKKFGFKNWDDDRNPFKKVFDQLKSSLTNSCSEKCKVDTTVLNELLNTDFSKFNSYKGVIEFNTKFESTWDLVRSAEKTKGPQMKPPEQWNLVLSEIRKSCQPLFASSPKAKAKFERIQTAKGERPTSSLPPIDDNGEEIEKIANICKGISAVKAAKAQKSDNFDLTDDQCKSCSIEVMLKRSNGYSQTSIPFKPLVLIAKNSSDLDDVLNNALTPLGKILGQYEWGDEMGCTYDPIETSKLVERLAGHSCVETIFIPDYYVINKMKTNKTPTLYKPFSSDDRFAVKIKNSCVGSSGAVATPAGAVK